MLFVVVLAALMCYTAHSEHMLDVFDMKPSDKALYFQKKWHKFKCTVIYHAHGQTKEQWRMIMERPASDEKHLKCAIFRTESYLEFQNFTMSLTGPGVEVYSHEATSIADRPLNDDELKLDKEKRTVSSVDGKFQKKLARLVLIARLTEQPKTEL